MGQVERELIQQVLQTCDRVQIKAAARLGINRNTLHKKLSEYRIDESAPAAGGPQRNGDGDDLSSGSPAGDSTPMKSDRTMPSTPNSPGLLEFDRLYAGDCLELFPRVASGSIDLVFADPPFNIGYDYDIYDDRREAEAYLDWTRSWGREVVRALKPDGTFWLAIGDEYAAELKILFHRELGLSLRSWVIWYYTFGVHCTRKFSRSHAHLFHFVKDPKRFTFNDQSIRVPSRGNGLLRHASQP